MNYLTPDEWFWFWMGSLTFSVPFGVWHTLRLLDKWLTARYDRRQGR